MGVSVLLRETIMEKSLHLKDTHSDIFQYRTVNGKMQLYNLCKEVLLGLIITAGHSACHSDKCIPISRMFPT